MPRLTAERVQELEESLVANPEDILAREELLAHYFMERFRAKEAHKARHIHAFWIIRNHPDIELAGTPYVYFDSFLDKEVVKEAKELWTQQIAVHPENTSVLGNAAQFFKMAAREDRQKALDLLHRSAELEPTDPEWPRRIGHVFDLDQMWLEGEKKKAVAQKALAHYENAYVLTAGEEHKAMLLVKLAENALAVEDLQQATEHAQKLLTGATLFRDGVEKWFYGNALHWSHIVLGQVALRQGDKDAAKEHLREAGNTPGSPQLDSFGPDRTLAMELLELGEKEAVLQYLKACSNFWECGQEILGAWIEGIERGAVPDLSEKNSYKINKKKRKKGSVPAE